MPVKLEGSCQCGGIHFTVLSQTPVPYQLCACSICRKCGGYGGSVNLGAIASSLEITQGKDLIKKYKAIKRPLLIDGKPQNKEDKEEKCVSDRSFCSTCSTMLWVWDETWPELIHPFASAIDTELQVPEEMVCVRGDSKPEYVRWPEGKKRVHQAFGDEDSIEAWHKKHGLFVE